MLSRTGTPCFDSNVSSQGLPMYRSMAAEDVASSSLDANSGSDSQPNPLLCSFSILKDKVHQVQSLVSILISPDHSQTESSTTSLAAASMINTVIQEIVMTASSIIFTCEQMALGSSSGCTSNDEILYGQQQRQTRFPQPNFGCNSSSVGAVGQEREQGFYSSDSLDIWYAETYNGFGIIKEDNGSVIVGNNRVEAGRSSEALQVVGVTTYDEAFIEGLSPKRYDVIELEATDLLAKFTHYCKVCAKGFKRDANLRMHMRAHGDEYKTSAALSNPVKNESTSGKKEGLMKLPRKYSCPQEGCRWNRKHAKFQPLKSIVCVKNHYKRIHCPKLYVCKRCSQKQFSVLSDLRTHEKHCGDQKWQCSCGTTFSRKDKLMGHVALFIGHTPASTSLNKMEK